MVSHSPTPPPAQRGLGAGAVVLDLGLSPSPRPDALVANVAVGLVGWRWLGGWGSPSVALWLRKRVLNSGVVPA